jgi:hypothetical protein
MSKKGQSPSKPESPKEKKLPETVLLSADELKAISGGAGLSTLQNKPHDSTANPLKNLGKG